jgi:hypothetical protein
MFFIFYFYYAASISNYLLFVKAHEICGSESKFIKGGHEYRIWDPKSNVGGKFSTTEHTKRDT